MSITSTPSVARGIVLPPIPPIGRPESWYARQVHLADKVGDQHSHEAYKVAQYVTLGCDPALPWPKKLRYFDHALRRHCQPPPLPSEQVWVFYKDLADLVRTHCGEQALFLASAMDDSYADRRRHGEPEELIACDAERFFASLMPAAKDRPLHFNEADWTQLKLIREQWV
jgi:hypothetical protein